MAVRVERTDQTLTIFTSMKKSELRGLQVFLAFLCVGGWGLLASDAPDVKLVAALIAGALGLLLIGAAEVTWGATKFVAVTPGTVEIGWKSGRLRRGRRFRRAEVRRFHPRSWTLAARGEVHRAFAAILMRLSKADSEFMLRALREFAPELFEPTDSEARILAEARTGGTQPVPGGDFPLVYRKQAGRVFRQSIRLVALLLALPVLSGLYALAASYALTNREKLVWCAGLLGGAVALSLIAAGIATALILRRREEIRVFADHVVMSGGGAACRLDRSEIAGVARLRHGTVLAPEDPLVEPITIAWSFALDERFERWVAGLPDLVEATKKQRYAEEVLANARLGATPEERDQKLARARVIARALNGAAVLVCLLAITGARHGAIATGAGLVLLGLIFTARLWGRGVFDPGFPPARVPMFPRMFEGRVRPTVLPASFLSAATLAILAINLDGWPVAFPSFPTLVPGALAGGCVAFLVARRERSFPRSERVGYVFWAMCVWGLFSGAAIVAANRAFDSSAGTAYAPEVMAKCFSGRKVELTLGPWESRREPSTLSSGLLGRETFEHARVGGHVGIRVFDGALGLRWVQLEVPAEDLAAPVTSAEECKATRR